ncbi:hypothetical protein SO694_00016257 [Aureococcus anophagefferens]|uniref:Nucleotide-diphospho-sugar transferase domain-containing protein n=1 Tax=Aureococcus anophagefferens TaxID=44056 RepID=A0ABR1G2W8_AURAN
MFLPLRTRLLLTLLLGLAVVWLRTASTRRPAPKPKPRATDAAPKPKPRPPRVEDVLEAASAQAQSKAAKAARTVWETTPPNVQTLLLTDEAGARRAPGLEPRALRPPRGGAPPHARGDDEAAPAWAVLRAAPFDAVVSVGNASEGLAFADMPQFQAFRAFEVTSVDGVKKDVLRKDRPEWTNREDATNRALRALRLAKIRRPGARALFAYTLFLDVDTIAWEAAYVKLSELGQLMDQPAFGPRCTSRWDRLRFVHLDAAYNCRGRDTARKNSVRISCDGYHDYENYLQKSLEGGKGCVVLHSRRRVVALRATWPNALPNYYVESSVPYGTLREATGPATPSRGPRSRAAPPGAATRPRAPLALGDGDERRGAEDARAPRPRARLRVEDEAARLFKSWTGAALDADGRSRPSGRAVGWRAAASNTPTAATEMASDPSMIAAISTARWTR